MSDLKKNLDRLPECVRTHGTGDLAHLQINKPGGCWSVSYVTNRREVIYVANLSLGDAATIAYNELEEKGYL
jgi:hypothetical protein